MAIGLHTPLGYGWWWISWQRARGQMSVVNSTAKVVHNTQITRKAHSLFMYSDCPPAHGSPSPHSCPLTTERRSLGEARTLLTLFPPTSTFDKYHWNLEIQRTTSASLPCKTHSHILGSCHYPKWAKATCHTKCALWYVFPIVSSASTSATTHPPFHLTKPRAQTHTPQNPQKLSIPTVHTLTQTYNGIVPLPPPHLAPIRLVQLPRVRPPSHVRCVSRTQTCG